MGALLAFCRKNEHSGGGGGGGCSSGRLAAQSVGIFSLRVNFQCRLFCGVPTALVYNRMHERLRRHYLSKLWHTVAWTHENTAHVHWWECVALQSRLL